MITIDHDFKKPHPVVNGTNVEKEVFKSLFDLPRGNEHHVQGSIRYFGKSSKMKDTYGCIVEEAPRLRSITFKHKHQNSFGEETTTQTTYEVWTPWMVYYVVAGPVQASINYMYFAKGSLSSSDTPLYFPTIPNIYFNESVPGKVCNGQLVSPTTWNAQGINWQATISGVISDFWSSMFNEDIMHFENLNPFSIVAGMVVNPEFDSPTLPTLHQGMMNWKLLGPEELMKLPFHYLFNADRMMQQFVNDYGFREETYDTQQGDTYYNILRRTIGNKMKPRR